MTFAEGLNAGLSTVSRLASDIQERKMRDLQMQDAQLGLQLKQKAVDRQQAYDEAGKQAWQQWQANAPVAENGVAAPRDPMDGYLVGMDAMHRKALELGDYDRAAKLFTDRENLRQQLLQKGLGVADTQFAASGGKDYTPYIDLYNKYWNDGRQIQSIGTRQDGAAVVNMVDNGKPRQLVLDQPGQLAQYMATLRDPTAARQAAMKQQQYLFEKETEANQEIRKKAAEQKGKVQTEGIKLGPNDKILFPDANGNVSDSSVSVENVTDKYTLHGDGQGGMFKLNTRTGDVGAVGGVGGGGKGGDWPGLKPNQIADEVKSAGSAVYDLARNPINGFQESQQGAIAMTAARAEEIMRAGGGRVERSRAAQQAIDESIRSKILTPNEDANKKPPRIPMPGALPPNAVPGVPGSNGISFVK